MEDDDFEHQPARIYKIDYREMIMVQAVAVQAGKPKPSFAQIIHEAMQALAAAR